MESESVVKKKKSNKIDIKEIIGLALIVLAVVLLVLFLINGETKVIGGFPDDEATLSLTCGSTVIKYPLFTENNTPTKRLIEIKIISDKDKVGTIALNYQLFYNTDEAIRESRDWNHYEMNMKFSELEMEPDSLGAMYSKLEDNFKFSLFAKGEELSKKTAKFFMLNESSDFKYNTVKDELDKKGFTCSEINKE